MKTPGAKKAIKIDQSTAKQLESQEPNARRRLLQPLQAAAGDKENLVGGGRMTIKEDKKTPMKSVFKLASVERTLLPGVRTEKLSEKTESEMKAIKVEDLTSEDGPSENYWEKLAEMRKGVLEKVLEENRVLQQRLTLLEEENEHCRSLLEESKSIINNLTELLEDHNDDNEIETSSPGSE